MKELLDRSTIIVVGSWNPKIFSPDWVKEFVCEDSETTVEYAIPVNNPEATPRITFEGVHLFVGHSRIEVKPDNSNSESLEKCASSVTSLLEHLQHTPVSALGINFSFSEEHDYENVMSKFAFNDLGSFDDAKYELVGTTVHRSFSCDDGAVLNLSISIGQEHIGIDFNYHFALTDSTEIINALEGSKVDDYHSKAIALLKTVYDLDIETQD